MIGLYNIKTLYLDFMFAFHHFRLYFLVQSLTGIIVPVHVDFQNVDNWRRKWGERTTNIYDSRYVL